MMTSLSSAWQAAKRVFSSPLGWKLNPMLRPPGVIVLTYHRITGPEQDFAGVPVETFAAQMQWVRDHCEPIEPEQLLQRARDPDRRKPPVLVTFDDGYRDFHDRAFPILECLQIPSLVFLATSFIDEGGMIWTDQLQWSAVTTKRSRVQLPWNQRVVYLPDMRSRFALGETVRSHLKLQPDHRRRLWFEQLLSELGNPPLPDRQMLSWDEVRSTMHLARFGGHTHTHPILSRIDRDACEFEISTCRHRIEEETGCAPAFFAYPNGRDEDYTQETKNVLRRHGFRLAFATCEGVAGPDSDWMAIRRLPASGVRTTLQAYEAQRLLQPAADKRLIGIP